MSFLKVLKSADDCFELELELLFVLCETFNTPHTLAIYMVARDHDWLQLKAMVPDQRFYFAESSTMFPDWKTFRVDRLVSRLLSKSGYLPTGIDTDAKAIEEFLNIEGILQSRVNVPLQEPNWSISVRARVCNILSQGEHECFLTDKRLEDVLNESQLGPGATTNVGGSFVQSDKLRQQSTISPALLPFLEVLKGPNWTGDQPLFRVDPSVEITSVPKNAYQGRTICTNPTLNVMLQRGLGKLLERILRRHGTDLRDQVRNQNLAKRAFSLKLATIDLSSASSWFTEQNLSWILPPDLMHFVDLVRPHYYTLPENDQMTEFLNWTPMGCGYTFPLMTLVFLALVQEIVPKRDLSLCAVYGDDLIVPAKYAPLLIDYLEQLGCKINTEKSFLSGSFYESCGTEWFANHDVLPFYCRKEESSKCAVPYRVQLANKLRMWVSQEGGFTYGGRLHAIWESLTSKVDKQMKPPVPLSLGDVGLVTSLEKCPYPVFEKFKADGYEGDYYRVTTLQVNPCKEVINDSFVYYLWLMRRAPVQSSDVRPPVCNLGGLATVRLYYLSDKWYLREGLGFYSGEPRKDRFGRALTKKVIARWLREPGYMAAF